MLLLFGFREQRVQSSRDLSRWPSISLLIRPNAGAAFSSNILPEAFSFEPNAPCVMCVISCTEEAELVNFSVMCEFILQIVKMWVNRVRTAPNR